MIRTVQSVYVSTRGKQWEVLEFFISPTDEPTNFADYRMARPITVEEGADVACAETINYAHDQLRPFYRGIGWVRDRVIYSTETL